MISILDIDFYVPKKLNLKKKYPKVPNRFWSQKVGNSLVPRKSRDDDVISMCIKAYKKIKSKINKKKIKCIIVCTQNPEYGGLPHNSAIIQSKILNNNNITCLDISHGCAGYLYAIKTAEAFLKKNEIGLIFTCDPYSKIIDNDFNTDVIFGDAASVTIVKNSNKGHILKNINFYTNGKDFDAIIKNNNKIVMNGRKVLNFSTKFIPPFIKDFIKSNKISNLKKIFIHQGSKFMIDLIKHELNNYSIPSNFKNLGNTVSSSIPILLKQNEFKKLKKFVICGFGVGLSISIGYIEKIR